MRIAIDVSPLVQPLAGVGVYTKKIVNQLINDYPEDEFVLFYTSFKRVNESFLPTGKNVHIHKINWPSKVFNLFQIVFAWPKIDNLVKADVFLFPNLQLWRWSAKAKVIMTVHDLSFAIMPWAFSYKMRLWHKLVNPQKYLPLTQKIIAVSNSTKNDLISLFNINSQQIETVFHGIDQPENVDNGLYQVLKNKFNLPDKFLLFVATLEPRKNLRLIIDAINVSSNKQPLIIVGRRGWLNNYEFKKIINNPRVKWLSSLNDQERDVLINHCQALVWPSLYEGFGLPPLEALVRNKKVISGIGGSLAEITGEYTYGFDSTNGANIVTSLNNLENLPAIEIDVKQLFQKYSWREAAKKLYYILYETTKNSY